MNSMVGRSIACLLLFASLVQRGDGDESPLGKAASAPSPSAEVPEVQPAPSEPPAAVAGLDEAAVEFYVPVVDEPAPANAAVEPAEGGQIAVQRTVPLAEAIFRVFVPGAKNREDDRREVQIKQVLPQLAQSYRPVLSSELAFIRIICEIPKEQRAKIKAAGEKGLQQAARQLAEQQFGGNRLVAIARDQRSLPDPRRTVRAALAEALKTTLTAEQFARYKSETDKRDARRKRAAIRTAVSQFDAVLSLNAAQRQAIEDSIDSHWQDRWEQWLMLADYGGQYFPTVPGDLVTPHLNEEQRSVWNGLQRIEIGFSSGGGEMIADDGWWGDEHVGEMEQGFAVEAIQEINIVPAGPR